MKTYRYRPYNVYREFPSKNHTIWINGRNYIDPSEKMIKEAKRKLSR